MGETKPFRNEGLFYLALICQYSLVSWVPTEGTQIVSLNQIKILNFNNKQFIIEMDKSGATEKIMAQMLEDSRKSSTKKPHKSLIVKLDSGREVMVHAFYMHPSYGDYLECREDDIHVNKAVFERASFPRDWGHRKLLKIEPDEEEFEDGLKSFCFVVWLISYKALNKDFDGSELVVIWFGNVFEESSLLNIIKDGVKSIDWEGNAQDFNI